MSSKERIKNYFLNRLSTPTVISFRDISYATGVDISTVSKIVKKLAGEKFISRKMNKGMGQRFYTYSLERKNTN